MAHQTHWKDGTPVKTGMLPSVERRTEMTPDEALRIIKDAAYSHAYSNDRSESYNNNLDKALSLLDSWAPNWVCLARLEGQSDRERFNTASKLHAARRTERTPMRKTKKIDTRCSVCGDRVIVSSCEPEGFGADEIKQIKTTYRCADCEDSALIRNQP